MNVNSADGENSIKRASILRNIVQQALAAFPDDAHLRINDFLQLKRCPPETIQIFQLAWSKTTLSNAAFGRSKSSKIDPELFSDELIAELSKSYGFLESIMSEIHHANLANKDINDVNLNHDSGHESFYTIKTAISTMDEFSTSFRCYLENLYSLPDQSNYFLLSNDPEADADIDSEALILFQESSRNIRASWRTVITPGFRNVIARSSINQNERNTNKNLSKQLLRIIPEELLYDHSYRSGRLFHGAEEARSLPKYFNSYEVIGLEIPNDHSSCIDLIYTTHALLQEFILCRQFNPLPIPVGNPTFQPESQSMIFAFEYHIDHTTSPAAATAATTNTISEFGNRLYPFHLLANSARFSNLLRQYPLLIHCWSIQLSLMLRVTMRNLPGFWVCYPEYTRDIYIREDGLLYFTGIAFQESHMYDSNDNNNNHHDTNKYGQVNIGITKLCYQLLGSILNLSRTISNIQIPIVSHFRYLGYIFQSQGQHHHHSHQEDDYTSEYLSSGRENATTDYDYILAVKSRLVLLLHCGAVQHVQVMNYYDLDTDGNQIDFDHGSADLRVVYRWEMKISKNTTSRGANKNNNNNSNDKKTLYTLPTIQCHLNPRKQQSSLATSTSTTTQSSKNSSYDEDSEYDAMLIIESTVPGHLTIEISAVISEIYDQHHQTTSSHKNDHSSSSSSSSHLSNTIKERRLGSIEVEIYPFNPPATIELLELMSYIEEYERWKIPTTIFHSYYFSSAREILLDDARSRNLILEASVQWKKVLKALEYYSNSSLYNNNSSSSIG